MTTLASRRVSLQVPEEHLALFEDTLLFYADATDTEKKEGDWVLHVFFPAQTSTAELEGALHEAAEACGMALPSYEMTDIADEDWQEKMRHDFPPLEVGRFFIHSFEEPSKAGMIRLHIPAGMAFGTGEHATTRGCLALYDQLSDARTFSNGLDMGCGSGILALAAAKKQDTPFLAVDIDAPSIDICMENMTNNGAETRVQSLVGDGFASTDVQQRAPYDLIFANILATPLIEMAADLAQVLESQGIAILSGFLEEQEKSVLAAYEAQGLVFVSRSQSGPWVAAAMQRP